MPPQDEILRRQIARLNARAWGVAGGLTLGVGLFVATAVLLLIGPAPGTEVGGTLGQLRYYLPGYSVTWLGSVVGLVYGFVVGYGVGRTVGSVYNRLVR
jgi:hypothetical protein